MKRLRKIASNQILMEDGSMLTRSVVEIADGIVQQCYPLTQELPFTEWLVGPVRLGRDDQGVLRAYFNNKIIQ